MKIHWLKKHKMDPTFFFGNSSPTPPKAPFQNLRMKVMSNMSLSFFLTNCTFLSLLSIQHSTGYIVEVLLHILLLANIPLWVNFQEYICTLVVKGRPSILAISFPIIWCTLFYFIPSLFIYILLLLILFNSTKLNFLFQFSLIMDCLCVLSFIILVFRSIS